MIDFNGVTAVTIPEGNVKKIAKGSTVLWEKASTEEYIVVFPKTTLTGDDYSGGCTYFYIDLTRPPYAGEKYIIYVNGEAFECITSTEDEQLKFLNGDVFLYAWEEGKTTLYMALDGNVPTVELEIHYIPE